VVGQVVQLDLDRIDLFGQFVGVQGGNDQLRIGLLQQVNVFDRTGQGGFLGRADLRLTLAGGHFALQHRFLTQIRDALTFLGSHFTHRDLILPADQCRVLTDLLRPLACVHGLIPCLVCLLLR